MPVKLDYRKQFLLLAEVSITGDLVACQHHSNLYSLTVNGDQQDATILAYLFITNQLYMFRAMSSPIIRST